jgi:hypothetical protein
MDAIYMNDGKQIKAGIGDVVMAPGNMRGIVIGVKGTFVTVLGIGTSMETEDTFVLSPRFIHDYPASECIYREGRDSAMTKDVVIHWRAVHSRFPGTTEPGQKRASRGRSAEVHGRRRRLHTRCGIQPSDRLCCRAKGQRQGLRSPRLFHGPSLCTAR